MSEAGAGAVPVPPAVEGDFYDLAGFLDEEDRLLLKRVRTFMEGHPGDQHPDRGPGHHRAERLRLSRARR